MYQARTKTHCVTGFSSTNFLIQWKKYTNIKFDNKQYEQIIKIRKQRTFEGNESFYLNLVQVNLIFVRNSDCNAELNVRKSHCPKYF